MVTYILQSKYSSDLHDKIENQFRNLKKSKQNNKLKRLRNRRNSSAYKKNTNVSNLARSQYQIVVEFRTDFLYRNLTQYAEVCTCLRFGFLADGRVRVMGLHTNSKQELFPSRRQ